jgi:hypothetical protein
MCIKTGGISQAHACQHDDWQYRGIRRYKINRKTIEVYVCKVCGAERHIPIERYDDPGE